MAETEGINWSGNCPFCGDTDCQELAHARDTAEYFYEVSENQMARAEAAESRRQEIDGGEKWRVGPIPRPWGPGRNENLVPLQGDGPPDYGIDLVPASRLVEAEARAENQRKLTELANLQIRGLRGVLREIEETCTDRIEVLDKRSISAHWVRNRIRELFHTQTLEEANRG